MTQAELDRIKKKVQLASSYQDKLKGRIEQIDKQLLKEHNCNDEDQARNSLRDLEDAVEGTQKKLLDLWDKYEEKYGDKL